MATIEEVIREGYKTSHRATSTETLFEIIQHPMKGNIAIFPGKKKSDIRALIERLKDPRGLKAFGDDLDFVVIDMKATEEKIAAETCPYCKNEIELRLPWKPQGSEYQIYCPFCGEKIMLCDACLHAEDNEAGKCDWIDGKGCWRGKDNAAPETKEQRQKRLMDECLTKYSRNC
jgi:hypothetical protein